LKAGSIGLLAAAAAASAVVATAALGIQQPAGAPESAEKPTPWRAQGQLVCLAEEMRARFGAPVAPVHDHLWGLKVEESGPAEADGAAKAGAGKAAVYVSLLRTPLAEGLFADERFRKHTLILEGRAFPGTRIAEVTRIVWLRDGKAFEVFYWCEVCAIRTASPGPCACCQGAVELRETAVPLPR
jgi:hypothetical protein